VITAPREQAALAREILAMRERLRAAHRSSPQLFDVKHDAGGMVDVEFAVQYLVLTHSHAHPELLDNVGNIALLQRAEDAALLPTGVGRAAGQAYRELRRIQHRARLDDASTKLEGDALTAIALHREAVLSVWQAVFPDH